MSTIASATTVRERPASLAAAVWLTVASVVIALATIPLFLGDAMALATTLIGAGLGLVALVAAWGLWQCQRWGQVSVFVITAINGLLSLPGVPFADAGWERVLSALGVVEAIVVCWLLLLGSTRAALR